jgi:hypothetical protein
MLDHALQWQRREWREREREREREVRLLHVRDI